MNNIRIFLALIFLGAFVTFSFAQSSTKQKKSKKKKTTVIVGATTVVDYPDTFKLNTANESFIKNVGSAKMQDGIEITVFLDKSSKGKTIKLKSNEAFDELFKNNTLIQNEGYVNPGKDFSKAFISSKGYHVEIRVAGMKDVFYGILEFNKVYNTCAGDPSARSYFIKIPSLYLENAKGGNISVVYEYYECAPREGLKTVRDYTTRDSRYTSWVLWMSDIKFE